MDVLVCVRLCSFVYVFECALFVCVFVGTSIRVHVSEIVCVCLCLCVFVVGWVVFVFVGVCVGVVGFVLVCG